MNAAPIKLNYPIYGWGARGEPAPVEVVVTNDLVLVYLTNGGVPDMTRAVLLGLMCAPWCNGVICWSHRYRDTPLEPVACYSTTPSTRAGKPVKDVLGFYPARLRRVGR